MSSDLFHKISEKEKAEIYNAIATKTGIGPYAVEKDWWVVQTLTIIFEMEIGKHLVFKGGTSLSKAWGLIDRFSEDIDLAVNSDFFGYEGDLSKGQITKLRKAAKIYTSTTFYSELESKFKERGLGDVTFKIEETTVSDQDPIIIEIHYPNVIGAPGYVEPKVQVEIGCRSLREPFSTRTFSSLVDEHYPDKEFVQAPIDVPTVNPERTFLEKIFLLHEEFQRPAEKMRVDRLSRHLYDIYKLSKTEFAKNAIRDKELYETIVKHRHVFAKVGGVNYNLHQPQTINPIPVSDVIEAWKVDYKTMQEQMIYVDSPDFHEMLDEIKALVAKINQLEWKMDMKFPLPVSNNEPSKPTEAKGWLNRGKY